MLGSATEASGGSVTPRAGAGRPRLKCCERRVSIPIPTRMAPTADGMGQGTMFLELDKQALLNVHALNQPHRHERAQRQ